MKRIELFEEGFFLTFVIDSDKAFAADAPLSSPFCGKYDRLVTLPLLRDPQGEDLRFCGYEDTGNQTGRAVTLSFCRQDGASVKLLFQFRRGCGELNISASLLNGADERRLPVQPFPEIFENCCDGVVCSVCEDGSVTLSRLNYFFEKTNY